MKIYQIMDMTSALTFTLTNVTTVDCIVKQKDLENHTVACSIRPQLLSSA